jgi:hypothetical protein
LLSQGFTLGYSHIAPPGRDIFIAMLSQGFTLGYSHIAPPGRNPVPFNRGFAAWIDF